MVVRRSGIMYGYATNETRDALWVKYPHTRRLENCDATKHCWLSPTARHKSLSRTEKYYGTRSTQHDEKGRRKRSHKLIKHSSPFWAPKNIESSSTLQDNLSSVDLTPMLGSRPQNHGRHLRRVMPRGGGAFSERCNKV